MSKDSTPAIIPTGKDGRVPFPRTLAGLPLFALAQRGKEHELVALKKVDVQLAVASKVRIQRWGVGLTAEHQDVLLAIIYKFAGLEASLDAAENQGQRLYVEVQFAAKELLDILGKSYNDENRGWLRRRLDELSRSHLTVLPADANPDAFPIFSGCILQLRARSGPARGVRCSVSLPIEFMRLFEHLGYAQIDLEQRRKLGSSQLARLLQTQIACLSDWRTNTHYAYTVGKWMELTGTKASEENFTTDLRKALKRLKDAGFLSDYRIERGKVHVALPRPGTAAGQREPQAAPTIATSKRHVELDGEKLVLGDTVPNFQEVLGKKKGCSPPLPIEVYFDSQLKAMEVLYPRLYGNRVELPRILARIKAELTRRLERSAVNAAVAKKVSAAEATET